MTGPKIDLRGQTFTWLTIPHDALFIEGQWRCICKCGNVVWVRVPNLLGLHGCRKRRSCGCRGKKHTKEYIHSVEPPTNTSDYISAPRKIYFMQFEDLYRVKIGIAADPYDRMKKLEKVIGCSGRMLAVVDGTFTDERRYHHQFAEWHITGEWFTGDDALIVIINRHVAGVNT